MNKITLSTFSMSAILALFPLGSSAGESDGEHGLVCGGGFYNFPTANDNGQYVGMIQGVGVVRKDEGDDDDDYDDDDDVKVVIKCTERPLCNGAPPIAQGPDSNGGMELYCVTQSEEQLQAALAGLTHELGAMVIAEEGDRRYTKPGTRRGRGGFPECKVVKVFQRVANDIPCAK